MSAKRGQRSNKPGNVPVNFAPGFLRGMDRRRAMAKAVANTMTNLSTAIGGDPSPQAQMLIEHGTWAHMRLRQLQAQFMETGDFDFRQYSSLLNSLIGALRTIGLARREKPAQSLDSIRAEYQTGGDQP